MKPLISTDLRHRIQIRRPAQAPDGKGGYTTSWQTVLAAHAEVEGLDGRESAMERVLEGVSVFRIGTRWRANVEIRASDQVRFAGRDLNVTAPASDPDGKRRQLVIMAESRSALSTP